MGNPFTPNKKASEEKLPKFTLYTDGSHRRSFKPSIPSATSWGFILVDEKGEVVAQKAEAYWERTINQAELNAVVEGLSALPVKKAEVEVYTDSQYVQKSMSWWIKTWRKANWCNHEGTPIKNKSYMEKLWALKVQHRIRAYHIRSHTVAEEDLDKEKDPHTYYNHKVDDMVQAITRDISSGKLLPPTTMPVYPE